MTRSLPVFAVLLPLAVSCTHLPVQPRETSERLSITLDTSSGASVVDAIRMSYRLGSGPYFTKDSLSRAELERIPVKLDVGNVTWQEYLRQLGLATGLHIEYVEGSCFTFRVTKAVAPIRLDNEAGCPPRPP